MLITMESVLQRKSKYSCKCIVFNIIPALLLSAQNDTVPSKSLRVMTYKSMDAALNSPALTV